MVKVRAAQLTEWHGELSAELKADQAGLAELQKRIRTTEQRLQHVEGLLAIEPGGTIDSATSPACTQDLLDACQELMRDLARPVHVKDLHDALLKKGVPIPGKGTEANLISRLQKSSDRFIRTGRGTYALMDSGLREVRPTRKRRRAPMRSGS
jgi:hypothetical protein